MPLKPSGRLPQRYRRRFTRATRSLVERRYERRKALRQERVRRIVRRLHQLALQWQRFAVRWLIMLAACLVLCLLKAGLFVLGASAFGTLAHFVYEALPFLDDAEPPFVLMGRSGYYYVVVGVAGIVGAVVAHVQKTQIVRITTSLLGGGGLALTTHLVVERESDEKVPDVALLAILVVGTLFGVFVQHRIAKTRRQKEVKK